MSRTHMFIIVGLFLAIVLFCAWQMDARSNRIEANVYQICIKEVGIKKCIHGRFIDPSPGF